MSRWIFLRHGESEANRARVFSGHHDVRLTQLGKEQATLAGLTLQNLLQGIPLCAVWSSDLQRARETAERALEAAQINIPIHTHAALRERHLGEWQGQSIDELKANGARAVLHAWEGAAPGGESLATVSLRSTQLLSTIQANGPVLIVGHGGLIRALLGLLDGTPLAHIGRVDIPNAVPIERKVPAGRWAELHSSIAR